MTAMVVARLCSVAFWQELRFEDAAGLAFGWFIFQYAAMRPMASGPFSARWTWDAPMPCEPHVVG